MNKLGQTFGLSILYAIVIFIFGILMVNFLTPEINTSHNAMSCTDTSISSGSKLTCLFVDIVKPYWILAILSLAGGVILDRLLI